MNAKLPYLDQWDVTPCTVTLFGGLDDDGAPEVVGSWSGMCNYSERVRRVQNKDGQWVSLAAVLHMKGDILPDVIFSSGLASVETSGEHIIASYSRPRNPDGSVNHTRIELY